MKLLRCIFIPVLCVTFSAAAQAAFLDVTFHGYVSGSNDEDGRLFGAGVGSNTIVGEEVFGSYRVDLGLAEYVSYDNDFAGDVEYSVGDLGVNRRFVTSDVSIGGQVFSLLNDVFQDSDDESVYMGKGYDDELGEDHGFWQISDEYYVPDLLSYVLDVGFSGPLMDYLDALTLDQEIFWSDPDFADSTTGGGGRLLVESNAGIGIANFQLDSLKVTRAITEVPEPSSLFLLLLGLIPLAARWYRKKPDKR